ncbi:MAG: hypothetical protein F7B18_04920 [Desulfurococcales archaeon]|nr:hypothetical protein [Desulfurococcales archaeon]
MTNPRSRPPPQADKVTQDIELLEAELGADAVDGLYSILDGGEDVTCFTAKRIKGRRDKRYGSGSIFRR